MPMKLSVGGGGDTEYEVPPVGEHKAICYRVIDGGSAEEDFQGEVNVRHKIFLFWELTECTMQDGRRMSVMGNYTASLNEKSKLYQHVTSWINRSFTDEEKQGFDPTTLVGKGCKLSIEHTKTGRAKVANVHAFVNAFDENEQLRPLPTENDQVIFDLEDYCKEFSGESCEASKRACDIFEDLPAFIRYRIAGCDEVGKEPQAPCFEMQAALKRGAGSPIATATPVVDVATDDMDPFAEENNPVPF
jgi:hypothetical protein